MLAAGAVFAWWKARKPPRMYYDPTNDRKRTVEVPVDETMEDVVWGERW